jgi:BirA family transcriptional regulator, biotin operon repressor / biotin---[acetyl-CoA-carboxylase] ligase
VKLPPGHRLIHCKEIDSTNAEAHRLAAEGERGPLWIWADRQTQGRGRLGRRWISEPGNLYVTHVFSTEAEPATAVQVAFVASLAVYDLASTLADSKQLSLKWPNDVLKSGAKCCGILPELLGQGVIALGMGVNLAHCPADTPYPVATLGLIEPGAALERLALALVKWLDIWDDGLGFEKIRATWLSHASGLGQAAATNGHSGIFTGLANDGALLLTTPDGQTHRIHAGEVQFSGVDRLGAMA